MGTRTDFFLASDEDLPRAFVGWKRPRAAREERAIRNPFTGQQVNSASWVADPEDVRTFEPFAGKTLGQRLARFPTLQLEDLDPVSLAELVAITLGSNEWRALADARPPLVPQEVDPSHSLIELPDAFVEAIAVWSDADLARVSGEWATGELLAWSADECAAVHVCPFGAEMRYDEA